MRFKRSKLIITAVLIAVTAVVLPITLVGAFRPDPVVKSVEIEAGGVFPDISVFLNRENITGIFLTDIKAVDTSRIGEVEINIEVNGRFCISKLIISDTVPPRGTAAERYMFLGNTVTAGDFVTDIIDATQVTCSFAAQPDFFKPGWQEVTVILTDEGFNTAEVVSRLYIYEFLPVRGYVFAGNLPEAESLTAENPAAAHNKPAELTFSYLSEPAAMEPGWQNADILITAESGKSTVVRSRVFVYEIAAVQYFMFGGNKILPENLLNVTHGAPFSCEFAGEPDFSVVGWQDVPITVTIEGGESVTVDSRLYIYGIEPRTRYIFTGNNIGAGDLIGGVEFPERVTAEFAELPDTDISGWHEVEIILTEISGDEQTVAASFYVFEPYEELFIEAGTPQRRLYMSDLVKNNITMRGAYADASGSAVDFGTAGVYSATIRIGENTAVIPVTVADTTPPTARVRDVRTYLGKPAAASQFVYDIVDFSEVTVRYRQIPNFNRTGTYTVHVILEDFYGNTTEYEAKLTIVEDTEPPKIAGEIHKTVVVGGTVNYTSRVTVTDNYDPKPLLTVDSSRVNLNVPGTYTVIYTAKDESGNIASVNGSLRVRAIDTDLVNEMADDILKQLITPNMTPRDKAYAIYIWVNKKVRYSAANNPREIAQAAYDCFVKGAGDCFVYMAASQVLLTRAGIDNTMIRRVGGETDHFWNLVNLGQGWFHFDACPVTRFPLDDKFMFGNRKARELNAIVEWGFYNYDASTVPRVEE
jgi:transglutaminase-like putative cysteine protease